MLFNMSFFFKTLLLLAITQTSTQLNCTKPELSSEKIINLIMTNYSRSRMPSNRPIDVKVELTIQDIASLSVVKNSFTADIWFSSVWHDPRLAFDMYDRCRTNLSFDDSFEKKIFSPNVCLVNTRTAIVHASPKANVLLMLLKNGTVFLNYRMRIESSCEMSLKDYPMDYHSCSLDFESYSYNTATVNIGWMPKAITFDTLDLSLSDFTVVNSSSHSFVEYYKAGQWGRLRATLTFKRKYSVHILQMYLPTYISVFIAFFAFLIDVKSLPARIVVGVNSIISLTYQKGNILATLPKSSELKAIDIFMGTCEAFIFATLLELAFVAYQDKKQLLEFDRMKAPITKFVKMTRLFGSLENPGDKTDLFSPPNIKLMGQRIMNERKHSMNAKTQKSPFYANGTFIDKVSFISFGSLFILFNMCYWTYYLTK